MKVRRLVVLVLLGLVITRAYADQGAQVQHRWIYLSTNMLVEENVERDLELLRRATKAGYNGVVLTDAKFMRWGQLPDRYTENVRRIREACRQLKLDCIAAVCPIGYSSGLLSHDPNLAAGLPVINAPFRSEGGRLVPVDRCD